MKHHEYQIYYGGKKELLFGASYCEDCNKIIDDLDLKSIPKNHVRSHKKQTVVPRNRVKYTKWRKLNNLSMRNAAYEKLSD